MRKKKSWTCLMALVLSVTMLVPSQAAYATEGQAEGEGVETYVESGAADADRFEIEDGVLKKYTGTDTEVVIPEGVTDIGQSAFCNCKSLTRVTIPDGVTNIGSFAFSGCSSLTSITIPKGVVSIGDSAFSMCIFLTSVALPEGLASIGQKAFENCWCLTSITIPKGVVSIGSSAFALCSDLATITVEEGNSIYDSRENCNALIETESNTLMAGCENTTIPEGVTSIGAWAFSFRKNLKTINLPEGLTIINDSAFLSCNSLEEIIIPEGVTKIPQDTFKFCSGLKKVTLPKGLKEIGKEAFWACDKLTEINLPEGLISIGGLAFGGCGLTSLTIPKSVTMLGGETDDNVFGYCGSLEAIRVEEGNTVFDSRGNCNAIIETASNTLITGCKNTKIPEGVMSIEGAFLGCGGLTEISIPEGVLRIGKNAFSGCNHLTRIIIPEGVTSIGSSAFAVCARMKEISIPESVTKIEADAFAYRSESLTIYGKAGSYAETYAKENNIKFSSAGTESNPTEKKTISSNNVALSQTSYIYDGTAKKPVVTVKDGNTVLKEGRDYTVTYSNNVNAGTAKVTVAGKGNYKGTVTKSFTIKVKKGTSHKVGSYQYKVTGTSTVSFTGVKNNKVTKVKIPKTVKIGDKDFKVTAIGSRAFKNNKKITSVEIGDNVKSIGTSAFEGCIKLSRAALGKGIIEIGGNAFKNCKKLGTITIKSTKLKKVGKNSLKGLKPTAKIKVPARKLSAYKKLFKNKGQGKNLRIAK